MQSHSRAHHHPLHTHQLDPAKVTITILAMLLFLIFLFLFLTLTATPAQGQNRVPPTAAQAAKMPQFASRLAHPMRTGGPGAPGSGAMGWTPDNASRQPQHQRATYRNPIDVHKRNGRTGPLDSFDIYDNGPTNGTVDAWTINSGFIVSDTFTLQSSNAPSGMQFAAWLFPGDILASVELSITSSEFGGTTYFDGVVNFTQGDCTTNQLGFSICVESGTFPNVNLNAGTYWMNLQNAVVNTGDPVYWDENSGPSYASENSVGTIPSESFTVLGGSTTSTSSPPFPPCFEPQDNLTIIHDFTPEQRGPSELTMDNRTGSLFGSTSYGGDFGFGTIYKLSQKAQDWILDTLYSFVGGENGYQPSAVFLGPDGSLYGTAAGGIESPSCQLYGTDYCGLVYKLTPPHRVCRTGPCGWDQTILYRFTATDDGWGPQPDIAIDGSGNLYGLVSGPAQNTSSVYELSPSGNGWTQKIAFTFPEGWGANSILMGRDGNLYGTVAQFVYQLIPSQNGWTMNILHSFQSHVQSCDYYYPQKLVQDSAGNLIGIANLHYYWPGNCGINQGNAALEYELSPSPNGWTYSVLQYIETGRNFYNDYLHGLAVDSNGYSYIAGNIQVIDYCPLDGREFCHWYVYGGNMSIDYVDQNFSAFGLVVDPPGNTLYGVTGDCGQYGDGTVWRLEAPPMKKAKPEPAQLSP